MILKRCIILLTLYGRQSSLVYPSLPPTPTPLFLRVLCLRHPHGSAWVIHMDCWSVWGIDMHCWSVWGIHVDCWSVWGIHMDCWSGWGIHMDQCEASTWIVTVRRPHGLLISVRQHAVEDFSLWCVIYYLRHWLLILHSVQALPWFIGNNFMDHVSVQVSLILKVISIWMNCVGILTLYLFLQWW